MKKKLGRTRWEERWEKTREKILFFIKQNSRITQEELANSINLSIKGIEWNLAKLKEEGQIRRVGPDKGRHWEIVDKITVDTS